MKGILGFTIAASLAAGALVFLSPLASESPDGLEHVIEAKGAPAQEAETEAEAPGWALFPDYDWRSGGGTLGTITSGLAGTAVVLLAGFGLAKAVGRRTNSGTGQQ